MPTIAKLEIVPLIYRLPKGRAYGMARGLTSIRQASLVKLTTDEGVEGIGEAWGPPTVTKAYLDFIASYFVGREVYGFEHAASAILSTHYHFGIQNQMTSCLSGIDIACLDAIGKMLSLPVVKLLGGPARDRLPIYASGGYFTESRRKTSPNNSNVCASAESNERRSRSALARNAIVSACRSPERCSAMIRASSSMRTATTRTTRRLKACDVSRITVSNGTRSHFRRWISTDMPSYALVRRSRSRPARRSTRHGISSDCLICAPSTSCSPTCQCAEAFGPDARSPCWLGFITCVCRHMCGEVESDWRRPAISSHRCPIIRTAGISCSRR